MSNTTFHLISNRCRTSGSGNPVRSWAALTLAVLVAGAAGWFFTRDVNWEARRREARARGLTAEHNGNFKAARAYYESALDNHPYDWETHLSLAAILNHRLNDPENALRHYLLALAYSPTPILEEMVQDEVAVLRAMISGQLENPQDALEDMFLSVEAGAETIFRRRLSTPLKKDARAYWEAWKKRGRGTVSNMRITKGQDGFFDAHLELSFPDETAMSMHLYSPLQDVWRLELSFP